MRRSRKTAAKLGLWMLASVATGAAAAAEAEEIDIAELVDPGQSPVFVTGRNGAATPEQLYSGVTSVRYNHRHGIRIEYTAPDGTAHMWNAENLDILKGRWRVQAESGAAQICMTWFGADPGVANEAYDCATTPAHQTGALDLFDGDVFDLAGRDTAAGVLSRGARARYTQLSVEQEMSSLPWAAMRKLPGYEFTGTLKKINGVKGQIILDDVVIGGKPLKVELDIGTIQCTPKSKIECGYRLCEVDGKVKRKFGSYLRTLEGQTVTMTGLSGAALPSARAPFRVVLAGTFKLEDGREIGATLYEDGWGFKRGEKMPNRFWRYPGCGGPDRLKDD